MSGKWSDPGVPHKGWTCVDVEDLGEPSETCEMCESAVIRYVHRMEHPDYAEELNVGCVCAEHMSGDYVGPKQRERELRGVAKRRVGWLQRRSWKRSASGFPYINAGIWRVAVFRYGGGWSFTISHRGDDVNLTHRSDRLFDVPTEAALTAYDTLPLMSKRLAEIREAKEKELQLLWFT